MAKNLINKDVQALRYHFVASYKPIFMLLWITKTAPYGAVFASPVPTRQKPLDQLLDREGVCLASRVGRGKALDLVAVGVVEIADCVLGRRRDWRPDEVIVRLTISVRRREHERRSVDREGRVALKPDRDRFRTSGGPGVLDRSLKFEPAALTFRHDVGSRCRSLVRIDLDARRAECVRDSVRRIVASAVDSVGSVQNASCGEGRIRRTEARVSVGIETVGGR